MSEIEHSEMMEAIEGAIIDAELARRQHPDQDSAEWLLDWFMSKRADCDEARKRIKERSAAMLRQVDTYEKGLWFKWGREFQAEVNRRLGAQIGKKKRSIDTFHGKTGYRSVGGKKTVVVEDEERAMAQAELLVPDAVKKSLLVSKLLEYAEQHEPIDGTRVETTKKEDSFYPKRPQSLLEADEPAEPLEELNKGD